METFAKLFKKYRLKAEFETCSSFGEALAQKGYIYDESIFSHWQKGNRIPTNRHLLLTIIKIFIERTSITCKEDANEFLETTGLGYLTNLEIQSLFITNQSTLNTKTTTIEL
jgi:hypothetical protein